MRPTLLSEHGVTIAARVRAHARAGPVASAPQERKDRPLTQPETQVRRILRTPTLWILLVAGALLLAISLANQAPPPDELTFSEFQSALAAGKVNDAKFL